MLQVEQVRHFISKISNQKVSKIAMYNFVWADQREKQDTTEIYPGKVMQILVDKPLIQTCCYSNPQCIVTVTR